MTYWGCKAIKGGVRYQAWYLEGRRQVAAGNWPTREKAYQAAQRAWEEYQELESNKAALFSWLTRPRIEFD